MVTTVGPAVGAKAQFGFSEESKWGLPVSPPTNFFEFTSEGLVSEFTNLVSTALRADRAVHRQKIGTEAAGGDVAFEFAPEDLGTMLKHACGKRRTKRTDIALVIVYTGVSIDVVITVNAGGITSTGVDAAEVDLAIVFGASQTCDALITAIAATGAGEWDAYACWGDGSTGYFPVTDKTAAAVATGVADYGKTHVVSTAGSAGLLEHITAIPCPISGADHKVFFPVNYKYGIFEHIIDTHPDIPEVAEGLTIEAGRDIAAFNYYGCKVNTFNLEATPGAIVTGSLNFMAKGASTCGDPVVVSDPLTGWQLPVVEFSYAGTSTSVVQVGYNSTKDLFTMSVGGAVLYSFSCAAGRGYHTLDGYYCYVSTIGGWIDFLTCCGEFSLIHKRAVNYAGATTDIANLVATPITSTTRATFLMDAAKNAEAVPLFRGDYIGMDAGTSIDIHVKVDASTTAFVSSADGGSTWRADSTPVVTGAWHDILDANNIDTGFDVMFPVAGLTTDDEWKIATFKDENPTASYGDLEQFIGAQGSVTLDGYAQVVMGLTASINNNLFGDKYELGDKQRAALKEQQMAVEGTITVEFDDLDLYRKFVNGIAADMEFEFVSDQYITSSDGIVSDQKYTMNLRFPNMKYNGTTPVAGGPEIIVTDFPFVALYGDTAGIPNARFTLINREPYV